MSRGFGNDGEGALYEWTTYYAFTPRVEEVYNWCARWKVDRRGVKPLIHPKDGRGMTSNYGLILFDGWREANSWLAAGMGEAIIQRAKRVIVANNSVPVVRRGRIVDWNPMKKEETWR